MVYIPQIGYMLATPSDAQTPDLSSVSGYTAHDLSEVPGIDFKFNTVECRYYKTPRKQREKRKEKKKR